MKCSRLISYGKTKVLCIFKNFLFQSKHILRLHLFLCSGILVYTWPVLVFGWQRFGSYKFANCQANKGYHHREFPVSSSFPLASPSPLMLQRQWLEVLVAVFCLQTDLGPPKAGKLTAILGVLNILPETVWKAPSSARGFCEAVGQLKRWGLVRGL